ncbi:PHP domain-containing protein [Thermanaerosceptrum fracticalcis]|uniref:PHP domain-containing protein n=1 Tax=Thermanaerosceptrum fracticalcis TaxID=1712410 RepID=A0A7G6DYT2_THEFR|nr:PHP domain-containing protein [Thermanaerosceptrum fracticalcis]QNB44986.1 PHP domain-containing protein [Thermanaerosceptrum fracticalcis]
MKVDLHVHTSISDSNLSIEETIKLSRKNGVRFLGITDHDTVEGLEEAVATGRNYGIQVIPGIEISAFDYQRGRKVHILGYNFDLKASHIKKLCQPLLARRQENSLWQIKSLRDHGFDISLQEVQEKARVSTCIYKQHIMAVLMDKGYTDRIYSHLYYTLFRNKGICARDIDYVDVFAAVEAVKKDGGQAILAHPGQLDSYEIMEELWEVGLDGVELYHEDHGPKDYQIIMKYAQKRSLLLTGGSDYHGRYGGKTALGGMPLPLEWVKPLLVG